MVENLIGSVSTVDRQYASALICRKLKRGSEHFALHGPMLTIAWTAIQPDFSDIADAGEQLFKKRQLAMAFMRQLRVQSQGRADALVTFR